MMTTGQIAAHYGVSTETVRRWIRQGCPAKRLGRAKRGGNFRLDLEAVESWHDKLDMTCVTCYDDKHENKNTKAE